MIALFIFRVQIYILFVELTNEFEFLAKYSRETLETKKAAEYTLESKFPIPLFMAKWEFLLEI